VTTLIATRGVSGCGKSHWARQEAARQNAAGRPTVVVERDVLRDVIGVDRHGDEVSERAVTALHRLVVRSWLADGVDVICADTNLTAEVLDRLRGLAASAGAGFRLVDFSHVPLATCVERNARRPERAPGRCTGAQVPLEALARQHRQLQEALATAVR
jgi:predicted kinase